MAVREFDGTVSGGHNILFSPGSLDSLNYGTVLFLSKFAANGEGESGPFILTDSGDSYEGALYFDEDLAWWHAPGGGSGGAVDAPVVGQGWVLVVARKDTGTADVRFSIYSYDDDEWFHENGTDEGIEQPDWASIGSSGTIVVTGIDDGVFRLAAQAVWSNDLPWSADTSGDSAIESAGLETAALNWFNNEPDAMWLFNQDSTTEDVDDVTGNGADQISISGTTVITDDDPPGFSFDLASDEEDVEPDVIAVTVTANDAMSGVGPSGETATVSTLANNATVERAGNPDGITATVSVTANNATVDAVGDAIEANAIAATVTVTANGGGQHVGPHVVTATATADARGADITAGGTVSPNRIFVDVDALDATVSVESETVTAIAQVATVSVTANNATPTGDANAIAATATVSVTAHSPDRQASARTATAIVDARGASAVINAGEIAQGAAAEVAAAAINATVIVSDNVTTDTFTATISVTANNAGITIAQPPPPLYTFFPPTVIEHFEHLQGIEFERKFTWEKGVSVVRVNGVFENTRFVVPDIGGPDDLLIDGVDYFVGGFHYIIPEPIALELIAAGYEPELIE